MGLLDRFKKPKKRSQKVGYYNTSGNDGWVIMAGYMPMDKSPDVQICVNKIADIVSSMSIALMQNVDNGDIQINNGLSRVVDIAPNRHQSRKTFIQTIIREAFLKGDGNAVVVPYFQYAEGVPYIRELNILDMSQVTFYETPDSYQIRYKNTTYSPEEVLHFVFNPSRDNHLIGEGFAPILKEVLENVAQGSATKNSFFKEPKPSLLVGVNSDSEVLLDKDGIDKVRNSYTASMENGKPWVVPAEEITVHQIKPLSLKDLAINESLEVERTTIASAFGVPPFMVGVGKFNRDEFNNFISTSIQNVAEVIQQELTKKLLYSDQMYFKFKNRSLLQYNLAELTAFAKDTKALGILNGNEARKLFDYSPVDLEAMNDYTTLENYIKVQDLEKQKKLMQEQELKGGEDLE